MRQNLEPLRVLDARAEPLHRLPPPARVRAARRDRSDPPGADAARAGRGARRAEPPLAGAALVRPAGRRRRRRRSAARRRLAGGVPGRPGRRHERRRPARRLRARAAGAAPTSASASARAASPRSTPASERRRASRRSAGRRRRGRRRSRASSTTTRPAHHAFDVVKDSVTIGRGGIAYPVDIRIARRPTCRASTLASAGIRRPAAFFLIDLSSLGHDAERPARAARLRRGRRHEARERRRNARCRTRRGSAWPTRCSSSSGRSR